MKSLSCGAIQPSAPNISLKRMTSPSSDSDQVSLLQQIATFFAGPSTRKPVKSKPNLAPPSGLEASGVEVSAPLLPPEPFLDDITDAEVPAELELIDLIPAGLSVFNLPHYQETLEEQIGPSCLINACRLEDRPLTETEMEAAELAELIPTELSKLDIARAKAAIALKENRSSPLALPDLATLERSTSTAQTAAAASATLQPAA
ncbi:MAG: hypothetical protein AAF528_03150 [Cyanobacteria bacterium P01_C01_bin.121]